MQWVLSISLEYQGGLMSAPRSLRSLPLSRSLGGCAATADRVQTEKERKLAKKEKVCPRKKPPWGGLTHCYEQAGADTVPDRLATDLLAFSF